MYVYIHLYTCVHIHIYAHTHTHIYSYTYIHTGVQEKRRHGREVMGDELVGLHVLQHLSDDLDPSAQLLLRRMKRDVVRPQLRHISVPPPAPPPTTDRIGTLSFYESAHSYTEGTSPLKRRGRLLSRTLHHTAPHCITLQHTATQGPLSHALGAGKSEGGLLFDSQFTSCHSGGAGDDIVPVGTHHSLDEHTLQEAQVNAAKDAAEG